MGPEAKHKAEEETGLFFPDPKHMTFGVYATLSRWWADEKKGLRANLERWGAAAVGPFCLDCDSSTIAPDPEPDECLFFLIFFFGPCKSTHP